MSTTVVLNLAAFFLLIGFGSALIAYRDRLAIRWLDDSDVDANVDATSLLQVGLILIGVWIVITTIPQFIVSVSSSVMQATQVLGDLNQDGAVTSFVWYTSVVPALVYVAELAVGLWLVFGDRGLAKRLMRPAMIAVPVEKPVVQTAACPTCGAPYDPADYRTDADARCIACHGELPRRDA